MNQFKKISIVLVILTITAAGYALADDLIIFPNKGQSNDQMAKDKFACYEWAKQQSGFDPMATPQSTVPTSQGEAPKGGVVKGATRGAVVGVAAGAIAGNAGKGAAIGAASGGLVGGMRRRDQAAGQKQTQNIQEWLTAENILGDVIELPREDSDPGDLTSDEIHQLKEALKYENSINRQTAE